MLLGPGLASLSGEGVSAREPRQAQAERQGLQRQQGDADRKPGLRHHADRPGCKRQTGQGCDQDLVTDPHGILLFWEWWKERYSHQPTPRHCGRVGWPVGKVPVGVTKCGAAFRLRPVAVAGDATFGLGSPHCPPLPAPSDLFLSQVASVSLGSWRCRCAVLQVAERQGRGLQRLLDVHRTGLTS